MAHAHSHDQYGNPDDFDEYLQRLEGSDRAAWQMPDRVVAALGLREGETACEIGAGSGYFSLRLARAAGERGHVFAVEADPRMLEVLRERIAKARVPNLTPVFALRENPLLPPASCDLALAVDTFHHVPDLTGYLRLLVRALKPGGRVAMVDFREGDLPVGPEPEHRLPREEFLRCAQEAGLRLLREESFLPYQYFLVLRAP